MIVDMTSGLVLVAELDLTVRMVTVDLLEDAGFPAVTVAGTGEALSLLEGRSGVRVLITGRSVQQQGDGIELAWCVCERWPEIRVVVTSGVSADVREILPPEARFLQKPYSFDALLREIKDAFPSLLNRQNLAPMVLENSPALTGVSISVGMAAVSVNDPDRT